MPDSSSCECGQQLPLGSTPHSLLPSFPLAWAPGAAWNNLGDAYERKKQYSQALSAYREVLTYAPDNKVAQARSEYCRTRLERTA